MKPLYCIFECTHTRHLVYNSTHPNVQIVPLGAHLTFVVILTVLSVFLSSIRLIFLKFVNNAYEILFVATDTQAGVIRK